MRDIQSLCLSVLVAGGMTLASCATEPVAAPPAAADVAPPPTATQPPSPDAKRAPVAEVAPAPVATAAKIDDDNWLPNSGDARAAFDRAVETSRTDPGGAVARFEDAARKAPYFYAAWYNAGVSAQSAGDVATAEKDYLASLGVRPDYGPALGNLALLMLNTGRGPQAQRLVDDARKQFPDRAGPLVADALLAMARADSTTAEARALAALKIDERSVPAMRVMASVFRGQGRLDTAKFALENALAVEPGNALAHLELAYVLAEQADEKGALVAYERAARLRPDLMSAQENYGLLLLKQGYPAEAVKVLETAARLQPKSGLAQLHLGNGYRAAKSYDLAERAYKKALELQPGLVDVHFNLGVLYVDNAVPGLEELARWQNAIVELRAYKEAAKASGNAATVARVDEYIDATDKRVVKELKRREREERRKKGDTAPAADAAAKPDEHAPK